MGSNQFYSGDPDQDDVVIRHDPPSGFSNNVALLVQRLATAGKGLALRVFSAGPGPSASFEGGPVRIAGTPGTHDPSSLPYGRPGTTGETGLSVYSSFDGGEDSGSGTDTTGRVNLYSYQRAQNGSFGENIRHFLMRKDAKSMDAWYFPVTTDGNLAVGYNNSRDPLPDGIKWTPGAWTGAHWEANDHGSQHMHWELEIPDATGALQGRIVVPFGDTSTQKLGIDKTNIGINQADLTIHASTGGLLRIAGSTTYNKDIEFSLDSDGNASYRRWKLRGADTTSESGGNTGSNYALFRYADDGTINATPVIKAIRSNGYIGINKSSPVANLDVAGTVAASGNALGEFKPINHAMVAWSYDPAMIANSHVTTAGNIYLVKLAIAADATVTKVQYYVSVAGSSVTSGQNFVGLYSSSGTLLGSVGVDSDITSAGLKTATISSTALTSGSYVWAAFVFNTTGTMPNLGRMGGLTNIQQVVNANLTASQYRFALLTGSNTSLPSTVTPGNFGSSNPIWAGVAA